MDSGADRMTEIGANVWMLCMNSAVQGPTDENGCGPYLHAGEFVLLSDYDKALKLIIEKDAEIERLREALTRIKYASHTHMAVGIATDALEQTE